MKGTGAPAEGRLGNRRVCRAVVAAGIISLLAAAPGSAEADFVPGRSSARALVVRAGPSQAGLAIAVNIAESMADHQGSVGRGVSTTFVSGVLGLVAPDVVENLPPPTRVSSTEDGSEEGRTEVFAGTPPSEPVRAGASAQQVWATDDPRGTAATTVGTFDLPGVLSVAGGRSWASAGVNEGSRREAGATVEVPAVELLGGMVRLESMRWRVTQRSGAAFPDDVEEDAGFTVGRIVFAGQELATPDTPAEVAGAFAQLNAALAPTGLVMGPPTAGHRGRTTTVSPLVVRMAGSDVGAAVLGPLFAAVQPAREAATGPVLEQTPELAAAILVADIVIGALSGAGGITFEIGGVEAGTDGTTYASPFRAPAALAGPLRPPGAALPATPARPASAPARPAPAPARPLAATAAAPAAAQTLRSVPVSNDTDAGPIGSVLAAGVVGTLVLAGAEAARTRRARFSFGEEG